MNLSKLCLAQCLTAAILIGASSAEAQAAPATVARNEVVDFTPQLKLLFRIAACGSDEKLTGRSDEAAIDAYCQKLKPEEDAFKKTWMTPASEFIAALRPKDLPKKVVYPFGGGDLLTALVTFPDAEEITTLSLEPAGDPRQIDRITSEALLTSLDVTREKLIHLFQYTHSLTSDLSVVSRRNKLPGELIDALVGIAMNGYEPVSLRYFQIDAKGVLHYVTASDLAASDALHDAYDRARLFADMELTFKPVGKSGPIVTHRHISANLDNAHLKADNRVVKYLELKGKVSVMTKAASFLLWWQNVSMFREYLLKNMAWMISD